MWQIHVLGKERFWFLAVVKKNEIVKEKNYRNSRRKRVNELEMKRKCKGKEKSSQYLNYIFYGTKRIAFLFDNVLEK